MSECDNCGYYMAASFLVGGLGALLNIASGISLPMTAGVILLGTALMVMV